MRTLTKIAFTLVVILSYAFAQTNYCTLSSCTANTHTACKYSISTFGAQCSPADTANSRVPTATEQTQILTVHNDYRRKVAKGLETLGAPGPQPSASNMRSLTWDSESATIAQIHSQQCVFGHDTCRNTANYYVGQNIYIRMSSVAFTTFDWAGAIRSWYNEVSNCNSTYVQSFSNPPSGVVIGHYTQVAWANTYTVGCGVTTYKDTVFQPTYPYKQLYVCNYGPGGNMLSQSMYKQGSAGSACPAGTNNSDGLCV